MNKTTMILLTILVCVVGLVYFVFVQEVSRQRVGYKDIKEISLQGNSISGEINFSDYGGELKLGLRPDSRQFIDSTLVILDGQREPIMIVYGNGTIWVREGQEKEVGEQLVKVGIGYGAYLDGYCDGLESADKTSSKKEGGGKRK